MKKIWPAILAAVLLLAGCGWMNETYVAVVPHEEAYSDGESWQTGTVRSYEELYSQLVRMVQSHTEKASVDVSEYRPKGNLPEDMEKIVPALKKENPLTAYAVESMELEEAEVGVRRMVNIRVRYQKTAAQIQSVQSVWGTEGVRSRVEEAMKDAESQLVLRVNAYQPVNPRELAEEFYRAHPDQIMEKPEVSAKVYPDQGSVRILDLKFQYCHSQSELLSMAQEVQVMLSSAEGYVRGQKTEREMIERLNSFLLPLRSREGTTSTPVYSLLYEGIGDSRSVAMVFQMLCERSGLECQVVTGRRDERPWFWNIVKADGSWYHADLPTCWEEGRLTLRYDDEMIDYQWQWDQLPSCPRPQPAVPEPQVTEPEEPENSITEDTQPELTEAEEQTEAEPDLPEPTQPTESENS